MVIKTASPGVIVNEVDLTRGTSDAITTNVGGMVGPFAKGPVDELVLVSKQKPNFKEYLEIQQQRMQNTGIQFLTSLSMVEFVM